ncbi:MAG TPA: sigma-70 family RNA polymerase sigma factor [Polyangia bacterium]
MTLGSSQVHDAANEGAFDIEATFRRHRGDLERWATRLGGPLVDAEDVAQEVMMVAHARLPQFRHEAQVTTWLFKTTRNIAATHRRRERIRRWLRGMPLDYAVDLQAQGPSVLEEMERQEAAAEIYSALDRLAEKYRSVVILFEIEGLSGEEVASLTGTSLATVWVRLHRGRKKLKAHYRELLEKRGEQ